MGIFDSIREKLGASGDEPEQKITDAAQQTTDEQKLASYVKNKVDDARTQAYRVALEALWMRNSAAVLGFTGVYWDATS